MKRQPTKCEKMFANLIPDKGYYPKCVKNSYSLTAKKTKQSNYFKRGRVSGKTFFQRRYTDGQQEHEKVLNITNHQRHKSKL